MTEIATRFERIKPRPAYELVAEAIERTGRARIILARCDSEEAVSFGRSMGFRLFQGRYVDRLLNTPGIKPFARSAG